MNIQINHQMNLIEVLGEVLPEKNLDQLAKSFCGGEFNYPAEAIVNSFLPDDVDIDIKPMTSADLHDALNMIQMWGGNFEPRILIDALKAIFEASEQWVKDEETEQIAYWVAKEHFKVSA